MTLLDILVPDLQAAFPDRGIHVSDPPDPVVTFAAVCPEVGDMQIYDDGDEATVCIEWITHHHVNPYDEDMSDNERYRWITDNVIEYLTVLFADQLFLWSIDNGRAGGGCSWPFEGIMPSDTPQGCGHLCLVSQNWVDWLTSQWS